MDIGPSMSKSGLEQKDPDPGDTKRSDLCLDLQH